MSKSTPKFPNGYPCRGELYYIIENPEHPSYGSEIWSNRIGLIVSNDTINKTSDCVEIVYLTTSPKKQQYLSPTHICVTSNKKPAIAMCEQIHSVDIHRLQNHVDTIKPEELSEIDEALLFSLSINKCSSPQGIFKKLERYMQQNPILKTSIQSSPKQDDDTIQLLTQERDSYKSLCTVLQNKLNSIHTLTT